ncbi:alpha-L-arabinofuranosidase C-terminal domain-containing protein [Niabella drilacis]|uniref:non-reducing end alpha-L-arabinofuranosidase n=1 Tax=Niabella drilacis (strain DSM 25811 / CCM 8410 / CCUG 62505 / LMG 26954 / E90) TaxID=1285928 RepID=A0A1G6JBS9_NIADE|nr:alpha-L-arabinofuranosidase C-terminal domain-containing protein [Niabella drilacis]SDC15326.1 Alpha-L-arabinofuranosidase [Niabella drilacis]
MKQKLQILIFLFLAHQGMAQDKTFMIRTGEPVATVSKTMYGVFFEDINMGADGGIYAELVKNRSFEFFKPLMGWKVAQEPYREGAVLVLNRREQNTANPRFIRVTLPAGKPGSLSLTNEGFRGMGIKKDLHYDFSFMYASRAPGIRLRVALRDPKGQIIGSATVTPQATNGAWKKQEIRFTATETEEKAQLQISFEGSGGIDLDMISLFPGDTWKGRKGGMRADMVQMLADMKPGFIRFPGGCIVEGFDLSQRYQWKKTIGPIEERQLLINRWNFEFAHRPAPDYFQTFGLGFFEYFQLAEDIGAEPLPILNCGMACQFNSAELVPLDQLDPYIQDALDLIEFANGPVTSTWGKLRAGMGHPEPFHLKMMGVGNENWGPQYLERLQLFQKAIRAKYPGFKIIASSGTDPDGPRFELLNNGLRALNTDFIDEHYYRPPQWFFGNTKRYDPYPRTGTKVFAGEYASHPAGVAPEKKNNWLAALSVAAFLTGVERNAAVVEMASYAPLFAHTEGWQWTPDLIWVNNLKIFGTPDYYVQKLYARNKGTKVVPLTMNNEVVAGQDSLYASAVLDEPAGEIIIKMVNALAQEQSVRLQLDGKKKPAGSAKQIRLQSDDLNGINSIEAPQAIAPQETEIRLSGKRPRVTLAPYSFTVLRIRYS